MPVPGRSALLSLCMLCVLCVPPMTGCFRDPPAPILGDPGTATGVTSWPGSSSETGAATGHDATSGVTDHDTSTGTSSEGSSTSGAVETTSETGCTPTAWYFDLDQDGHGDPASMQLACEAPRGHVELGDDCDDNDAARAPSLLELCDDKDNDCDVLVDEYSEKNLSCKDCELWALGTSSYALCEFKRTYKDARIECQKRGGDLTVIEEARENLDLAKQANLLQGVASRWFIGINDVVSEGNFVWLDGDPVDFTSWGDGEPNNTNSNEDCGELYAGSASWNDQQCGLASFFICEAAAAP